MGRRFRRHYVGRRKSERSKSKLIIFLVLLFTALVVFLSIKLGLQLRAKAEKVREESEFLSTAEPDPAVTMTPLVDVKVSDTKVQASFVSVSDPQNINVPRDAAAISAVFKSAEGVNFYRSPAVEAVSGPQNEMLPSADELMAALTGESSRVCAVFYRENTVGMDDSAAQAVLGVSVSQMCEIAKAGADEILLMGFDTSAENLDFLSSAAGKIRAAAPNTLVGIALPMQTALSGDSESVSTLCRTLSEYFDIIALDLTELRDSESRSASEQLLAAVENLQLCFARYNIRCVFADGDENGALFTRILEDALLQNYQFTSKTGLKTEMTSSGNDDE